MNSGDEREDLAKDDLRISADFLLAEFNALQNRAIAFSNNQSNRVNFLLAVVAAALAGGSQLVGDLALHPYFREVMLATALGILLLGLFTLRQNVDYAVASVILFRRAGRVRLWFVEQDPKIAQYVAFEYGDDRPAMDVPFLSFRGSEAVVLLINALAVCAIVIIALPFRDIISMSIEALVSLFVAWIGQLYYVRRILRQGERRSAITIKFPFQRMREKYEKYS